MRSIHDTAHTVRQIDNLTDRFADCFPQAKEEGGLGSLQASGRFFQRFFDRRWLAMDVAVRGRCRRYLQVSGRQAAGWFEACYATIFDRYLQVIAQAAVRAYC